MWYRILLSAPGDAAFAASANELLRSTSRRLILLTGGGFLACYFASVVALPESTALKLFPVALAVALGCVCSLQLLPRSLLASQVAWQAWLLAAITFAVYVFQRPEAAFFYALLPLMAAISIGWPGALLSAASVTGLVWGLHSQTPAIFSLSLCTIVSAGAVTTGLVGWTATQSLLTLTQWSLAGFERAQRQVAEASHQRLQLKQVQQDLVLANTELARISDRLEAMHQVAEEARRAKEEFVANVSHEMRTPINMITGFCEMITESPRLYGAALPPALLADLEIIQRNGEQISRLINDVLDLSQVQAGRMALSKEWCCLNDLLEEAALAVRPLFDSKGLYLEMDIQEGLPPVYCDGTRVRQVVLNLLSNAGRFTEQGGVRVQARRDGASLVVSVQDTGPGISPEDQKRLFEPFQQLDGSIRRRHGGSGLGLCISKQFVELHGGSMWLESAVGVGSTIHFSLPLAPLSPRLVTDDVRRWFSPYHQYENVERTERSRAPAPTVAPRFVVLEQDKTLSRMLGRYVDGAEIVSISDSRDAVAALAHSPAVALVINAGSHAGEHPAHQVPNLPYDTPVMTCWVPTEVEAAERLGAVRYLTKPVSRQALLGSLAELGPNRRSVLVVDDEPDMLQLMVRTLSSAGYQPLQAANGQRALELMRRRRPDIVILDLMMPEKDGFQVLREKSLDTTIRDIPVVVISARNPSGEGIVSDSLLISRHGGLSARDLLGCLLAASRILSPSTIPGGQGQPESPAL